MTQHTLHKVLVTGGNGFLGSRLAKRLREEDGLEVFTPRKKEYDLRDVAQISTMLKEIRPDTIIHLAAAVGGIGANRDNPGLFFYENAVMGIHLIEEARKSDVQKFVGIGTVCAYPKFCAVPFKEDDLWMGYPEETNAPYGLAKKMMLVQLDAYRQQYNFNGIYILPVNLYGPGDNFDLHSSHVIPALIRKCLEAKETGKPELVVWGSGTASREFLYVEDAVDGIIRASQLYNSSAPVNLGSGVEITIRDLVTLICELVDFKGEVIWDSSKPDGQPRRCLDTTRAEKEFGFRAKTSFREGLKSTIAWYQESLVSK